VVFSFYLFSSPHNFIFFCFYNYYKFLPSFLRVYSFIFGVFMLLFCCDGCEKLLLGLMGGGGVCIGWPACNMTRIEADALTGLNLWAATKSAPPRGR
jgi:hypothetical protein